MQSKIRKKSNVNFSARVVSLKPPFRRIKRRTHREKILSAISPLDWQTVRMKSLRVGQWNLQGLGKDGGQKLAHALEREALDVVLACETRQTHEGSSLMKVPGYRVAAYSSRETHISLAGDRGGGSMVLVRPTQVFERLPASVFLNPSLGSV